MLVYNTIIVQDVCGLLPFLHRDHPDQLYRLLLSLFLNAGAVHLAATAAFHAYFMADVERMCGPAVLAAVYLTSGAAGNLASTLFVPYKSECGPSGAVFGVAGVMVAEVVRAWPVLRSPWRALGQMAAVLAIFLVLGIFPWVDNFAHLAGFATGLVMAVVLLPRVSEDWRDNAWTLKRLWPLAAVAAVLMAMLTAFVLYSGEICSFCHYFSCIPVTRDFCAEQEIFFGKKKRYF